MKNLKFAYLGLFALFMVSYTSVAQLTSGVVVYDMEMTSTNEQTMQGLAMMAGSKMTLTFDEENYSSKMSTPFYISETIFNAESDKILQLNEAGGMKSATFMSPEELKEQEKERQGGSEDDDTEVEETDEEMEIEGYNCRKVLVTKGESTVVMWVTDEIDFKPESGQFSNSEVDGFPLRIETDSKQMGAQIKVILTASKIKEEIKSKDPFNIDVPKGYEEMTLEQLKARQAKMMGGGGQ